jgi:hypothetical protein
MAKTSRSRTDAIGTMTNRRDSARSILQQYRRDVIRSNERVTGETARLNGGAIS